MSKNISEEIKILQQELKELKCWIKENWNSLPDVVQTMLVRGQLETENRVEQLKIKELLTNNLEENEMQH